MPTLFRRDAVVAGGLINALTPLTASILAAQGAAPGIAAAVHFTPLPDNVLLFAALGRPPQRTAVASPRGWQLARRGKPALRRAAPA